MTPAVICNAHELRTLPAGLPSQRANGLTVLLPSGADSVAPSGTLRPRDVGVHRYVIHPRQVQQMPFGPFPIVPVEVVFSADRAVASVSGRWGYTSRRVPVSHPKRRPLFGAP